VASTDSLPRGTGLRVHGFQLRLLRWWSRHLLTLNLTLCAASWLLYGGLELRGYGEEYLARTRDLWLTQGWPSVPGLENVLLPATAAAFARGWQALGLEFTQTTFIIVAAVPYVLFIYGLTLYLKRPGGGRLLALAAAITLYTSGMIPYMTSWGGSVDGLTYLAMLPVFIWPGSLAVFTGSAVLHGLNHYAGLIALVLLAFVWHTLRALDHHDAGAAVRYWLRSFASRAMVGGGVLIAFIWFWEARYPDAATVRQLIIAEKWAQPGALLLEVAGPFPWTLLSTLKLAVIPVVAVMVAPQRWRALRAAVLAVPFIAAAAFTLVFVDVTRTATMLIIPAWLTMIGALRGDIGLPPVSRRRGRRLVVAAALGNLLIPNYYVNDGSVHVPASNAIHALIAMVFGG